MKRKLKLVVTAIVAMTCVAMFTVFASANDALPGLADSLGSVNLTQVILEPILAIIPIAIPVTLALLGLKMAIRMFRSLLKG